MGLDDFEMRKFRNYGKAIKEAEDRFNQLKKLIVNLQDSYKKNNTSPHTQDTQGLILGLEFEEESGVFSYGGKRYRLNWRAVKPFFKELGLNGFQGLFDGELFFEKEVTVKEKTLWTRCDLRNNKTNFFDLEGVIWSFDLKDKKVFMGSPVHLDKGKAEFLSHWFAEIFFHNEIDGLPDLSSEEV